MSSDSASKIVSIKGRAPMSIERAVDERDLALVAELERRFADALVDVAALGGVSIDYLDALLRASWGRDRRP